MHAIIAHLLFPLTVCGSIGGALIAIQNGIAPALALWTAAFSTLALVALFERLQPYEADWNRSRGDLQTDALYLPTFIGVGMAIEPAVRVVAVAVGGAISETIGMGLWPNEWSLLAQLALACVFVEAFDYWPHRLLHEVPWLWRFHAIHHNPKRIYWLNASRSHPVEMLFRGAVNVLPLALVGAGEELLALVALTDMVLGLFQHANIDLRLGPLTWIFSVGEMHRWHHSLKIEEANSNYGSNFLFWDIVFGTRFRDPERDGPDEIGIAHDDLPTSYWQQLGAPFRSS